MLYYSRVCLIVWDFWLIGSFYGIYHDKGFKSTFTKEKASIFSWAQSKGMNYNSLKGLVCVYKNDFDICNHRYCFYL